MHSVSDSKLKVISDLESQRGSLKELLDSESTLFVIVSLILFTGPFNRGSVWQTGFGESVRRISPIIRLTQPWLSAHMVCEACGCFEHESRQAR